MFEDLQSEFEQYKRESIKWSLEDFTLLEVEGYTITEEQAQNALEAMIENSDCQYGTTWESVQYYYTLYGTKIE